MSAYKPFIYLVLRVEVDATLAVKTNIPEETALNFMGDMRWL